MRRKHKQDSIYHIPRDTLETDRMARRRPKTYESTANDFFVPSFAIRRPVLRTDNTIDLVNGLKERMPKNWRVFTTGSLALTLVEQRALVREFRKQDECPDSERVEKVAYAIARQIKTSLHGVPRRLDLPTGAIFGFGQKHDKRKLGVIPAGWRGFSAPYAERGADKSVQPMPVIVRETNIAVGAIANEFAGNGELVSGLRSNATGRTPHITFAQKIKGGPISQQEEHAFAGLVNEVMPPSLTVFDPVIYLRLEQDQQEPIIIHTRSPRSANVEMF